MKLLIKTALILATLFASTFIFIKISGILTIDDVTTSFESLKHQPAYIIGALVILLLLADLFIAIPTMTVIILSGYFLGFGMGALFAFAGLASAAMTGYAVSYRWGDKLLRKINRDEQQRLEMQQTFSQHGIGLLILSRAMPILPEVCACLAGTTKMPLPRFLLGWALGSIPYLLIITYAGSMSSLDRPMPAIYTAIGVSTTLWLSWSWFYRRRFQPNKIAK